MPNVSFQAPNEYSTELADIERRRKMAELLQQQAMEPIHQQPTPAGGFAVPISWTQGLAKALQGYAGQKGLDRASEQQRALGERYTAERGAALSGAMRAGMGTPAQTIQPDPQEAMQSADQGTPEVGLVQQAAIPGNRSAMLAQLMGSKFPDLQQAGMTQAMGDMKPTVLGRTLVTPNGQVLATDSTWKSEQEAAKEARLAEIASRGAEARTSREEADVRAAAQAATARAENAANREAQLRAAASMRAPAAVQPLVQIMGENGQPIWAERKDAVGKVPAGAGSKAEASIAGSADVDKDVVKLKDMLDRLKEGGGITDTTKGAGSNIGAAIGASGVGQTIGGALGTKNQSARNELLMIRPSLLRSIMSSTGMSAKQMDSNAELKLWLSTATDPTKDYQANIAALDNIARKYGSGGFLEAPAALTAPNTPGAIAEGSTATGPGGQKIIFHNGAWVPNGR